MFVITFIFLIYIKFINPNLPKGGSLKDLPLYKNVITRLSLDDKNLKFYDFS